MHSRHLSNPEERKTKKGIYVKYGQTFLGICRDASGQIGLICHFHLPMSMTAFLRHTSKAASVSA